MASDKADQLKRRVSSIGAAKLSTEDAQIAVIEEYLRYEGTCGSVTGDGKLKRQGKTDRALARIKQKVEKVVDKGRRCA